MLCASGLVKEWFYTITPSELRILMLFCKQCQALLCSVMLCAQTAVPNTS